MPSVAETTAAKSAMAAALATGVDTISSDQIVTFTKYVRLVLPMDGYVFWVNASLLGQSAALDADVAAGVTASAPTLQAKGSLHYTTEVHQDQEDGSSISRVVFTSEIPINDLSAVAPNVMYIGEFQGKRFAFSSRASFYRQADLYHYVGDALYSTLETQLIDTITAFDAVDVVVSNSLPFWLALQQTPMIPAYGAPVIPLYPSFAIPENLPPPYGSVHVYPESQTALQATPRFDSMSNHSQLVTERVRITFYGLRNFNALDFQDLVEQYTMFTGNFGIMNMPVMRDEKKTQRELGILAMKKSIEYEINYYQSRVRTVARQLILSALPTLIVDGVVIFDSMKKPGVYGKARYGQALYG